MMEQPNALLHKRNPQALRRIKHRLVVLTPRRRCNVPHAGAGGAVDVVRKGELVVFRAG